MNMNIKSKEGIADFIEANLKELGGDAYGVDYVAEKLWEWHESELKNLHLGVVTCWLDFRDELPNPLQEIYVLDRYGNVQATTHQGDWQKDYWIKREYLWTTNPACR